MALAKTEGLHPEFRRRLEAARAEFPFYVLSGYRSSAEQKRLYDCYKAGKPGCNPANPPGTSNHEAVPWGPAEALAADIHPNDGSSYAAMQAACRRHGIHFPIASERWHAQPVEAKSGKYTGRHLGPGNVPPPPPPPPPHPPPDPWRNLEVPILLGGN